MELKWRNESFWSGVAWSKFPFIKINLAVVCIVGYFACLLGYLVCKQRKTQVSVAWSTGKFIISFKRCLRSWVVSGLVFQQKLSILLVYHSQALALIQCSSPWERGCCGSQVLQSYTVISRGGRDHLFLPSLSGMGESLLEDFPLHLIGQEWVRCPGPNQSLIRRMGPIMTGFTLVVIIYTWEIWRKGGLPSKTMNLQIWQKGGMDTGETISGAYDMFHKGGIWSKKTSWKAMAPF